MPMDVINCEFCGSVSQDEQKQLSQHIVAEHKQDSLTKACSESSSI
ncbi:hypothetical protein CEXT_360421, partial [Caerostris extrusa]